MLMKLKLMQQKPSYPLLLPPSWPLPTPNRHLSVLWSTAVVQTLLA